MSAPRGSLKARVVAGAYDFRGGAGAYEDLLASHLARLDAGTVLMCHPGPVEDVADSGDTIAAARAWEYETLGGETFAELLQQHGLKLCRGHVLFGT